MTAATWHTLNGAVTLRMAVPHAQSVFRGAPEELVGSKLHALARVPYIQAQLAALDPHALWDALGDYEIWTEDALMDDEDNLTRVLWLAALDISNEPHAYTDEP